LHLEIPLNTVVFLTCVKLGRHVRQFGRLKPALPAALLPEASRLIAEALELKPAHSQALMIQGEIRLVAVADGLPSSAGG
jgi:hypothetical protein